MRNVDAIKQQVQSLSQEELAQFRDWFFEYDWQAWDAQIETAAKSGKLDKLLSDAKAEFTSGRTRKL